MASHRCKKIMDCFCPLPELPSYELKRLAGFGKGGEKNFDGTVTKLQEQGYLVIKSFSRRRNARGEEYGWPSRSIPRRRTLVSPALIAEAYREDVRDSARRAALSTAQSRPGRARERPSAPDIRRLINLPEVKNNGQICRNDHNRI